MKNLSSTLILVITFGLGVCVSVPTGKFSLHSDCPLKWDQTTLEKPLFSLDEAKSLLDKRVRANSGSQYPKSIGKVIHLESVKNGRFLLMVTWGNSSKSGPGETRVFDKASFQNLEILD